MPNRQERLQQTRVYLILTLAPGTAVPEAALGAALASGSVGMVQLRMPDADEAAIRRVVAKVHPLCQEAGALLLLNDRADLAAALDLDGAHVGQEDLAPAAARALLGPARLLGLSTHDEAEVRAARRAPVDYLGLGPCHATTSKMLARTPAGPALVARCAPAAGPLPLFPIGGITPENIAALAAAGARRAAIGSGILDASDPAEAARICARLLARP